MTPTRRAALATAFSLSLASALAPAAARADARADLADIRRGLLPVRHEMLGWTPAGAAVIRSIVCAAAGTTRCVATLSTLAPGAPARDEVLLDVAEVYCSPRSCEALSPEVEADFVAAEARALAALPPLAPGGRAARPAAALGAGTRLEPVRRPAVLGGEPGVRAAVELRGARRARSEVMEVSGFEHDVPRMRLAGAYVSPDGASLALVVDYTTRAMCWGPTAASARGLVDLARHRPRGAGGRRGAP